MPGTFLIILHLLTHSNLLKLYEVDIIVISILQVRELRQRVNNVSKISWLVSDRVPAQMVWVWRPHLQPPSYLCSVVSHSTTKHLQVPGLLKQLLEG